MTNIKSMRYSVFMRTPLGKKYGTLIAQKTDDRLSGTLEILGHKRPFSGEIDLSGKCRISGSIVTLLRTFYYTAAGSINEGAVHLLLTGDRDTYEIIGTAEKTMEGAAI